MNFRPYHNPENIDESLVPAGWRFRYADEIGKALYKKCRCWGVFGRAFRRFSSFEGYQGNAPSFTYIVPVNS